jgi:predicted RNA binding protein YcfA (HicA-like mRNA interferase family)
VRPVDWRELVKLCEIEGCRFDRQKGDHYIMVREGLSRPIVIPAKKDLGEDIVLGVGRTLGLSRKQLLERLEKRRRRD